MKLFTLRNRLGQFRHGLYMSNIEDSIPYHTQAGERRVYAGTWTIRKPRVITWMIPVENNNCGEMRTGTLEEAIEFLNTGLKVKE